MLRALNTWPENLTKGLVAEAVGAVAKGAVDVGAADEVDVAVETHVVGSLGYTVDVAAAAAGVGGGTTEDASVQ